MEANTWRVYAQEWVVGTTTKSAEVCREYLENKYVLADGRARLPSTCIRVVAHPLVPDLWQGEICVWVLRGEFKRYDAAKQYVSELVVESLAKDGGVDDIHLVERGSRAEARLRDFGVKVLHQEESV
jgi:hypothetical protein